MLGALACYPNRSLSYQYVEFMLELLSVQELRVERAIELAREGGEEELTAPSIDERSEPVRALFRHGLGVSEA